MSDTPEKKSPADELAEKFHKGRGGSSAMPSGFQVNRRIIFAVCTLIALLTLFSHPIIGLPCLLVVIVVLFFTLKDPKCPLNVIGSFGDEDDDSGIEDAENLLNLFSLMRTPGAAKVGGSTKMYDKFIDVLIKGGVIDANTDPHDIQLKVIADNPPTYELRLNQIGKTESQLVSACNSALLAYDAYLVDVEEIGGTDYRITYKIESDVDQLAGLGTVGYETILDEVEKEGTQIDLKHLPAGKHADGSIAYVNLGAGNSLCQGEPGSGKSVYLSALSCSILRAVPQIQFAILSPKALDFQNFMDVIPVIQDPQEQLAYLQWVEEQGEKRKQVCMERHIKKIDKDLWDEYPPIVVMIDEYATIHNKTIMVDGRKKNIGLEIDAAVNHIVAELRFAAVSVILTTQRFDNTSIDTTLRANISGTICSFATNKQMTDSMIWDEDAMAIAQCYKIKKSQVGCGYIAVGGEKPKAFKGAFADDNYGGPESQAAEFFMKKRDELESKGRPPFPTFTYTPEAEEEAPKKRRGRR